MAYKLRAVGNVAQDGAVLPQTSKPEKDLEANSGSLFSGIAAQAVPASKVVSQPAADSVTAASINWKPSTQVTVSTSTDSGSQDSLQFTDKRQAAAAQPIAKADNSMAFGVQLKSSVDAALIKQTDAAAATIQADPSIGDKVVQQIVQQAVLQTVGDKSVLTIHLSPPELGSLRLNVTSQSGALTTDIQSQNASVRSLLETHLPAIREALSNAGIEVSTLTVSSGSDFSQLAQGHQQTWQQPNNHRSAAAFAPTSEPEPTAEAVTRPGTATLTATHSWLA